MTNHNIDAELKAKFSRASADDWEKIATQELKGRNPFQILSWRGKDGLLFLPYYDAKDVASLASSKLVQSAAEENFPSHSWLNLPLVQSPSEHAANKLALDHLLHGADGIVFDIRNGEHDLNKLTSNVEWPHCYTGFLVNNNANILNSLTRVLESSPNVPDIQGGLFWETIPKKDGFDFYLNGRKKFKSLGIVVAEEPPSFQISNALLAGIKIVDDFSNNYVPEHVYSSIAFSITADACLLETIAKLRALRRLWFQVSQAYALKGYNTNDLFLHVRIPDVGDGSYAPHQNMLNGTFASLGAILGGCNAISIESEVSSSLFTRWSRNVSSILREESLLSQAADPFAGAWAIELMTDRIAQQSWELFQQKWRDYATT